MQEIVGLVGAATTALEFVKTAKGFQEDQKVASAVAEVQNSLSSLLGEHIALQKLYGDAINEMASLKERVREIDDWKVISANYILTDVDNKTFAYALREDVETEEPHHILCPHCYHEEKKSILQFVPETMDTYSKYVCLRCKSEIECRGIRS